MIVFFKFDYKSGYYHVNIFPDHAQFLGCSWTFNGQCRYFKFTVLRFGLATAPFLFTKIQKALVKHWRRQGLRVFTYLNDGEVLSQIMRVLKKCQFKFNRTYMTVGLL